jgi:hypothetical protein
VFAEEVLRYSLAPAVAAIIAAAAGSTTSLLPVLLVLQGRLVFAIKVLHSVRTAVGLAETQGVIQAVITYHACDEYDDGDAQNCHLMLPQVSSRNAAGRKVPREYIKMLTT